MAMAAKKYLLSVANKNYMEMVEKRNAEIRKEKEELEQLKQKTEKKKKEKEHK